MCRKALWAGRPRTSTEEMASANKLGTWCSSDKHQFHRYSPDCRVVQLVSGTFGRQRNSQLCCPIARMLTVRVNRQNWRHWSNRNPHWVSSKNKGLIFNIARFRSTLVDDRNAGMQDNAVPHYGNQIHHRIGENFPQRGMGFHVHRFKFDESCCTRLP